MLVREFLCKDQKILGLIKIIKPLGLIAAIAKGLDLRPRDAADVTFELIKHVNPHIQDRDLEKYVNEGLPLGSWNPTQFPVPTKLKKAKPKLEMSPLRGEPEFQSHLFPPQRHRKMPVEFPYDDQTVRWSRVRGITPKAGHKT